jgi:hypothetical protein
MKRDDLDCDDLERRRELRRESGPKKVSGLGSVEVMPETAQIPLTLLVTFIGTAPAKLAPEHFVLEGGKAPASSDPLLGGRGPRPLEIVGVRYGDTRNGNDRVELALSGDHDHSVYTLRLVVPTSGRARKPAVDPRYDRVSFVFDLECPRVDCLPACNSGSGVSERETPDIDYLARDYGSFRRLMLDRLSLLLPSWTERHEADLGIMLVELLAYVGDQLAYQQDAVATEAYIGTARQRISVRRHGRLVDYQLHEGCNARAFVQLGIDEIDMEFPWDEIAFATAATKEASAGETFLPVPLGSSPTLRVRHALDEIAIYTWGGKDCCLARGATRATLAVAEKLLEPGDFLLFEEVLGPRTGRKSDADPQHRHVVRLTRVEKIVDPLDSKKPLVEVYWSAEDALPFSLCLSTITAPPKCSELCNVSVARGNVFLVDHGHWIEDEQLGIVPIADVPDRCDGAEHLSVEPRLPGRFRPAIAQGPLTFRAPLPSHDPCSPSDEAMPSAAALLRQDPRSALPALELFEVDPRTNQRIAWTPRHDLLESGPADRHFVAEIDDQGVARLRFGDGVLGDHPAACATMSARFRIGNGTSGNVGSDTITRVLLARLTLDGVELRVRNPLPARGGVAPEDMEEARELIAFPLRNELRRAITAEDYEAIAERDVAGLQNASADLLWNGSWYEAHVALDPIGRSEVDEVMLCRARRALERVRRIGHDLSVGPAQAVPLRLALRVCARPGHLRAHVREAVVRALGRERLPDGSLGFFHPDQLSFGEPVLLSRIVARVAAVEGVGSVRVERFERLFAGSHGELERGYIPLARMEIARLDNDPVRPENGILDVKVEGGR